MRGGVLGLAHEVVIVIVVRSIIMTLERVGWGKLAEKAPIGQSPPCTMRSPMFLLHRRVLSRVF